MPSRGAVISFMCGDLVEALWAHGTDPDFGHQYFDAAVVGVNVLGRSYELRYVDGSTDDQVPFGDVRSKPPRAAPRKVQRRKRTRSFGRSDSAGEGSTDEEVTVGALMRSARRAKRRKKDADKWREAGAYISDSSDDSSLESSSSESESEADDAEPS